MAIVQEICSSLLEKGKLVRVRVIGTCMTGSIDDGEAILIAPAVISHVRFGDIVVFFDGTYIPQL